MKSPGEMPRLRYNKQRMQELLEQMQATMLATGEPRVDLKVQDVATMLVLSTLLKMTDGDFEKTKKLVEELD